MPNRMLRDFGGSGYINIPIDLLRQDGYLEDGQIQRDVDVRIDRLDRGTYAVRLSDDEDDEFPEIGDAEAIRKEVALEVVEREGQLRQSAD